MYIPRLRDGEAPSSKTEALPCGSDPCLFAGWNHKPKIAVPDLVAEGRDLRGRLLRLESLEERTLLSIGTAPDGREFLASPSADVSPAVPGADRAVMTAPADASSAAADRTAPGGSVEYQHVVFDRMRGTPTFRRRRRAWSPRALPRSARRRRSA